MKNISPLEQKKSNQMPSKNIFSACSISEIPLFI